MSEDYWARIGQFEGLTKLGELELDNEPWQFNLLGLWQDVKGRYWLGTDSGCSCPTPWESHHDRDDLTGPLNGEQAREEAGSLIDLARPSDANGRWATGPDEFEVKEFLNRIV